MNIKNLFKDIEVANKLNEKVGNKKIRVVYEEDYIVETFYTYNDYKKYIKETYIKEVIDLLLNVEFNLEEKTTKEYKDVLGTHNITFEFTIE